jgi:hypothetical protein
MLKRKKESEKEEVCPQLLQKVSSLETKVSALKLQVANLLHKNEVLINSANRLREASRNSLQTGKPLSVLSDRLFHHHVESLPAGEALPFIGESLPPAPFPPNVEPDQVSTSPMQMAVLGFNRVNMWQK